MKTLVAGILAGIVLYAWGMVSWMVLPWHTRTLNSFTDEAAVQQALSAHSYGPGVYMLPNWPNNPNDEEAMAAFTARHETGPVALVALRDGREVMPATTLVAGVVTNLLTGLLLAVLVGVTGPACATAGHRVGFVVLVAVVAGLSSDVMNWNWMHVADDYTVVMLADRIVGFTLAGLVLARMVPPTRGAA